MSFIGLSTNISLMAVLYVGGKLITTGEMTAGSLTRFAMQSAFVGLGFRYVDPFPTNPRCAYPHNAPTEHPPFNAPYQHTLVACLRFTRTW